MKTFLNSTTEQLAAVLAHFRGMRASRRAAKGSSGGAGMCPCPPTRCAFRPTCGGVGYPFDASPNAMRTASVETP